MVIQSLEAVLSSEVISGFAPNELVSSATDLTADIRTSSVVDKNRIGPSTRNCGTPPSILKAEMKIMIMVIFN